LAKVNVNNPHIGEVNAGVATQDTYESEDLSNRSGGLVSIELKETLVGNVNVDVLKSDGKKDGYSRCSDERDAYSWQYRY